MAQTTLVLPLLLLCASRSCVCADVQANPGEDVTLQCEGPTNASIELIAWTRTDLKSDLYVFFFRDGLLYEHYQLPSYRGRVEPTDPEMKNASVILKNITVNDTGTYQCQIKTSKGDAPERNITVIIEWGVKDEGNLNKHLGLFAVLILSLIVIVVVVVGFFLWTRQRSLKKNSEQPAADEADQLQKISVIIV